MNIRFKYFHGYNPLFVLSSLDDGISLLDGEVLFPRIRSISARTISSDLVNVEPMSTPMNVIFYWNFSTGEITIKLNPLSNFKYFK